MQYTCLLSIYVDDFKAAGPSGNMDTVWKELRKFLTLDDPTPFGRYLGCTQHKLTMTPEKSKEYLQHIIPVIFKDKLKVGYSGQT